MSTNRTQGFTLVEVAMTLIILAVLAAMLAPLGSTLMDTQRASTSEDDLNKIYTAIVGNPKQGTFGYLGDVGDYPSNVMDLIAPSPVPTSWNGPYISDARIDGGALYDSFGSPVEYFQTTSGSIDQLALISRGPDRNSTNTAANTNKRSPFNGTLPSDPLYGTTAGNTDNIVYPHFVDNLNLLSYQSHGKLSVNITNYDDAVGIVMPGCANYFDVIVSSIPRNTNEAYVNYNPGGASFDLLQGLYQVKVVVNGSTTPVWQEQIAITPDNSIIRNISLSGVNSSLFGTFVLTIVNSIGASLQFYQGATLIGTITSSGAPTGLTAANRCSRILVRNATTNLLVDSFLMPNGPAGMIRRYNNGATCSMTFSNQSTNRDTIAIYDDNLLIGTVGRRGNKRSKAFNVRVGDVITWKDPTNTAISSTNLGASYTVACPATTAQF
jgi:prepilin-type N-terminal cleavage/methylation domain-containing protein